MANGRQNHWEQVHQSKAPGDRSWFQPRPDTSLSLIERAGINARSRVIDVGGGTSRLVDELLQRGTGEVAVLDIAPSAIEEAKQRLGEQAQQVRWIVGDVTEAHSPGQFDFWHDRAVFHFLTDAGDRAAYVRLLEQSVPIGGHVIIATFAEDGPPRCSGLPVRRHSPQSLSAELGDGFALRDTRHEPHETPSGKTQQFVYCLFERVA